MRTNDSGGADSALGAKGSFSEETGFSDETRPTRIERLFREQNPTLVRMLYAILRDRDVAQEVAQEAYEEICKRERAGARIVLLRNYLFRTARNIALNRLRQHSQRFRHAALLEQLHVPDAPSAEQTYIRQEESLCLEQAVQGLPPKTREAFMLVKLECLPVPVVAKRMGVEPNSVYQLCRRANAHLMKALADFDQRRGGKS
jgi:RNA polymerase sigma-70 factor (ECF subfamily)